MSVNKSRDAHVAAGYWAPIVLVDVTIVLLDVTMVISIVLDGNTEH